MAIDERLFVLQGRIGKCVKERFVPSCDRLASTRLSAGEGALDDTVLGVEVGERVHIAAVPGVLEAHDQVLDFCSGHG
jgi:hypothetical protein